MEKLIYLDNAATTRIYPEVAKTIQRESEEDFFNPSALYKPSVALSVKIKNARESIKSALKAPDGELYFLSGGTEADNTALFAREKQKEVESSLDKVNTTQLLAEQINLLRKVSTCNLLR